jgi:hypothetical protein
MAVVRDSKYLNWRYIDSPNAYKIFSVERHQLIKGFIVLTFEEGATKRGRIVEILVEQGQKAVTNLLLTQAIGYFFDQGADVINCWILEKSPAFTALEKRGFVKRETPHDLIVRSHTYGLSNEYFADDSKWYITMGDSDYF